MTTTSPLPGATFSPRADRRWRRISILIVTTFAACCAFLLYRADSIAIDDGYFYLVVARNIAHGRGPTFNGVEFTNGYHPLWQMLLAAVATLSPLPDRALLREALGLQFLLFAVIAWLLVRWHGRGTPQALWSACLVLLIFLGKGNFFLMEGPLAIALLLASLLVARRMLLSGAPGLGSSLRFGLLLGLAVLGRLDLVFTAAGLWLALGLGLVWERWRGGGAEAAAAARNLRILLPGAALSLGLLAAYMACNQWFFGSALPISGRIKSRLTHPAPHFTQWTGFFALVLILTAVPAVAGRRRFSLRTPAGLLFAGLWAGLLLDVLYEGLASTSSEWYFVEGWVLLLLLLPSALARLSASARVQAALAGAACLLALLLCVTRNANRPLGAYLRQAGGWYREGGLARLWAKTLEPVPSAAPEFDRLVPPGGRVLVWDGPGNLAWYSHRDIFPTDGLIDGARYSEQLAREGALHFFCTRGVAYIAAFEPPPETAHEHLFLRVARAGDAISFEVFTPLGHRSASGWTMRDEDSMGEIAGYKLGYPGFQTARMRRIPCPAQPASPAAVR